MDSEVIKGKKKLQRQVKELRRLHQNEAHPVPGHQDAYGETGSADSNVMAEGFCEEMNKPDMDKSAREMSAAATAARNGNPARNVEDYAAQRTGNGAGRLAVGNPGMPQRNTDVSEVLATLRTCRGNVLDLNIPDNTSGGFSHPAEVAVHLLDAAGASGSFRGMMPVSGDPLRPADHPASTSGTAPNGTHSLSNPTSHVRKSRVGIMKEALFPDE
jgi:hypothetical protein